VRLRCANKYSHSDELTEVEQENFLHSNGPNWVSAGYHAWRNGDLRALYEFRDMNSFADCYWRLVIWTEQMGIRFDKAKAELETQNQEGF
jgi:hypothetical protein